MLISLTKFHDSKAGKISEFIVLLTGEHKQDLEKEEIDYQLMTKDENNKNDDETDACTMATKILYVSSSTHYDDEESFPCNDDSQYADFEFGEDDEEDGMSIINNEEDVDSMIIKMEELSSLIMLGRRRR